MLVIITFIAVVYSKSIADNIIYFGQAVMK